MAEWTNAAVLKTAEVQASVGSNPTPSAIQSRVADRRAPVPGESLPKGRTTTNALLEVPITFDVGGEVTHAPMVEATVGGTRTKLIVDTGSTDHILTRELADMAGLKSEPGEPGTDSNGASVPSWTLGEVTIQIGDRTFTLRSVVAITGPEPFADWGIGGILSPQHLHPTAYVVVDLLDHALILVEGNAADVTPWVAARSPTLHPHSLDRASRDSTILVHAAIDPFAPVVTMLDTGGKRTEFGASAVPGLRGDRQGSGGRGVGGGQSFGSEVEDQRLRVGNATVPVPRLLLRDDIGNAPGLIGMDILRGTVLMVSADQRRPVIWLLPTRTNVAAE